MVRRGKLLVDLAIKLSTASLSVPTVTNVSPPAAEEGNLSVPADNVEQGNLSVNAVEDQLGLLLIQNRVFITS